MGVKFHPIKNYTSKDDIVILGSSFIVLVYALETFELYIKDDQPWQIYGMQPRYAQLK
jgi:hypothetical protein